MRLGLLRAWLGMGRVRSAPPPLSWALLAQCRACSWGTAGAPEPDQRAKVCSASTAAARLPRGWSRAAASPRQSGRRSEELSARVSVSHSQSTHYTLAREPTRAVATPTHLHVAPTLGLALHLHNRRAGISFDCYFQGVCSPETERGRREKVPLARRGHVQYLLVLHPVGTWGAHRYMCACACARHVFQATGLGFKPQAAMWALASLTVGQWGQPCVRFIFHFASS